MDKLKRILGILWMVLGFVSVIALVMGAVENIDLHGKADINRPVPWIIIITILLFIINIIVIAIGLVIFGWYAWKGEYDGEIVT